MGVTPVRALNSIKRGGIEGGVANNPIEFWILRIDVADSILGKCGTSLAEDFYYNQFALHFFYRNLPLTLLSWCPTKGILMRTAATTMRVTPSTGARAAGGGA